MLNNIKQQLIDAQRAHQQGDTAKAQAGYKALLNELNTLTSGDYTTDSYLPVKGQVLTALSQLYLQMQNYSSALQYLSDLLLLQPKNSQLLQQIIQVSSHIQDWSMLCTNYRVFITAFDRDNEKVAADHYFNLGYYYKQAGDYHAAISQFERAIDHGINQAEEVYLNLAVIYSEHLRQEELAKLALNNALKLNKHFTPALYNLATLYEEEGSKEQAEQLYLQTLHQQPQHYNALARLADLHKFTDLTEPLIEKLQHALSYKNLDVEDKINLNYALGKAFDDCAAYQQASEHYTLANGYNSSLVTPYNPSAVEQNVASNINAFNQQWFSQLQPISDAQPLFICGMFRSGSTLIEQILASHNKVTAGGELNYFSDLVNTQFANSGLNSYPNQCTQLELATLKQYAENYLNELKELFPQHKLLTDKRPDNFLYLGLIKTLFPNAKIIHTQRDEMDNCLSVYFLRLAERLNYATDVKNIRHFYQQQEKLIEHFKSIFPDTIYTVNYDQLVTEPKLTVKNLLNFLTLEWDDNCLKFEHLNNKVKTASVWKIRQPIFQKSSGRWQNYQQYFKI